MAKGMAGKRTESLVPKMTSWILARHRLRQGNRIFETRVRSDFFLNEEDDMLCAVLPCLISLLKTFTLPFSINHGSVEAIFSQMQLKEKKKKTRRIETINNQNIYIF